MKCVTDMETWLLDSFGKKFRYWVYRRMFTPYEQQNAFSDESQFEDTYRNTGYIVEAIDLGGGEWLLGFQNADVEVKLIEYYRLSEIRLQYLEEPEVED